MASSLYNGMDRSKRCYSACLKDLTVKLTHSWLKDYVSLNARGYFWTTWPQMQPVYHVDRHINWGCVHTNMDKSENTSFFKKNFTFCTILASILRQWILSTCRYITISFDMALEINDIPRTMTHIKPAVQREWCVFKIKQSPILPCLHCWFNVLIKDTYEMWRTECRYSCYDWSLIIVCVL